jgi:hypothetical protein
MSGHLDFLVSWVVLLAATAFALWKGDLAVRICGIGFLVFNALALPPIASLVLRDEVGGLVEDLVASIGFLLLAIRFANLWVGAIMIVQALEFSLHAYSLLVELRYNDRLHVLINNTGDFIIVACIVAGTISAIRRRHALAREEAELHALREQRAAARA